MQEETKRQETGLAASPNGQQANGVGEALDAQGQGRNGRPLAGPGANGQGLFVAPRGGGYSLKNLRTFSSFKSPVFRLFYASMLGQMAAMNMEMIARSLLIYRMTHSASILGLMALAQSLPMLFFSLYGGVMADRVQKKYILILGQGSNALAALVVGLALSFGILGVDRPNSWWILVVIGVFKGATQGFMMPSRQAIIPEIVRPDQIMNALALNNLGMNILRLMAPALAGFFVDLWGFGALYYVMVALYVEATATIMLMPPTGTMALRGGGALRDLNEGFRYVRTERTILAILLFTLVVVLCSMPYMQMLPVFTESVLKVGASGMGVLISVSGIGALVASLALASMPNQKRGVLLLLSSLVLGVALTVFSFSGSWYLSLAAIVFIGIGQTGRMTLSNALLQTYAAPGYLGRVMSIYMMDFALTSFSAFLVGVMTDVVGVQWAVGGLAIALVGFSTLALVWLPRIRRME